MSLIKSISGIRGTIGGGVLSGLNPVNISKFVACFAKCIKQQTGKSKPLIVVGRDARLSGEMVLHSVIGSLIGTGCDIVNIGLSTTPTTEMAVTGYNADGGIIITASHNPKEWNALKLLNSKGLFFSAKDGENLIKLVEDNDFDFVGVKDLGKVVKEECYIDKHINEILKLEHVDVKSIKKSNFSVAFDAINSVGGIAIPKLLNALGIDKIYPLNDDLSGNFTHNPEPLPENLNDICNLTKEKNANVAFVVDPDVDRLSIIDENGVYIGEEYTLVSITDYLLSQIGKGNTVSNLSSTKALKDVTLKYGGKYEYSAVGEVNVVNKMHEIGAVIGGEGNGGIIYPALHSGRDALVGIALFLSFMAKSKKTVSEIRAKLPSYYISKQKIELSQDSNAQELLNKFASTITEKNIIKIDGIKIEFENSWVHIRSSNTEPIIRIYAEAMSTNEAEQIANKYKMLILSLI